MSDDEQVYISEQGDEIVSRSTFLGLNRNFVIDERELSESVNMSDYDFPALSTRPRRHFYDNRNAIYDGAVTGAAIMDGRTALLTVNGTLYYGSQVMQGLPTDQRLIKYNRRLYLFPAGVSVECPPGANGSSVPFLGDVTYTHIFEVYGRERTDEEKERAKNSADTSKALVREQAGATVSNAYIGADGIPVDTQSDSDPRTLIKISIISAVAKTDVTAGDIVHIRARTGNAQTQTDLFEGDYSVEYVSADRQNIYITILLQVPAGTVLYDLTVERKMPKLDVCFEHAGRLWGARFGENTEGAFVNEIYCTALNNYENWFKYGGTAADSWACSLTSEGTFTGGGVFRGCPVFFKEQGYYRIFGDNPTVYQMDTTTCEGIEKDAGDSAVIIGGALYYKSPNGIMRLTDALPERISNALGFDTYHEAAGGTDGIRYYIRLKDAENDDEERLHVYNTETGLWHTETMPFREGYSSAFRHILRVGSAVYSIADRCVQSDEEIIEGNVALRDLKAILDELLETIARGGSAAQMAKIAYAIQKPIFDLQLALRKTESDHYLDAGMLSRIDPEAKPAQFPGNGTNTYNKEDDFPFEAVTGPIGYERISHKYLNKMLLRALISPTARLDVEIQYDSEDEWRHAVTLHGSGKTKFYNTCIRPVRCDSFRLRYSGIGEVKIVNADIIYSTGSDRR